MNDPQQTGKYSYTVNDDIPGDQDSNQNDLAQKQHISSNPTIRANHHRDVDSSGDDHDRSYSDSDTSQSTDRKRSKRKHHNKHEKKSKEAHKHERKKAKRSKKHNHSHSHSHSHNDSDDDPADYKKSPLHSTSTATDKIVSSTHAPANTTEYPSVVSDADVNDHASTGAQTIPKSIYASLFAVEARRAPLGTIHSTASSKAAAAEELSAIKQSTASKEWKCERCGFANYKYANDCGKCHAMKRMTVYR